MTLTSHSIIKQPEIKKTSTGMVFYWLDGDFQDIAIEISRIKENNRQSSIECEIEIAVDGHKYDTDYISLITSVRTNLLSISARNTLTKTVKDNCITEELRFYDWGKILNLVSSMAVREIRKTEPCLYLDNEYGQSRPEYILEPLFVKGAPTILYAERSSAKSLFANLMCICLTLPYHDNQLGLDIPYDKYYQVLYLDWESNHAMTGWQKESIIRGLGLGYCGYHYQRFYRPLADIVDDVKNTIEKTKAEVVFIDSLGMAVGDDLNLTSPAFAFWAAVRELDVTPIIIGHTSKDTNTRRKTVYGNAYYEAEARSVWELSKYQLPGSNELTLSLYNRKPPPFAGVHSPMAFRFIFEDDKILVEKTTPEDDKRSGEFSPKDAIEELIRNNNGLQPAEIYNLLNQEVAQNSIYQYCKRLKDAGKIKMTGNGYVALQ